MKSKLIALFIILVSSVQFAHAMDLKIATWNIYWLGSQNNQRTPSDYEELKGYANQLDADVIALQEVESAEYALKVLGDKYSYVFTNNSGAQRVGIAYKPMQGYEYSAYELAELDVGHVRPGIVFTIKNKATGDSVDLLALHLKSGCFQQRLNAANSPAACEKFAKQVPVLKNWINQEIANNKKFIILGDFNRRFNIEIRNSYSASEGAFKNFNTNIDGQQNGLWIPNAGKSATCWNRKYPEFIDYFVASDSMKNAYVENSFSTLHYNGKFSQERMKVLSDHCPISVKFAI